MNVDIFRKNKIVPVAILHNVDDALRVSELLLDNSLSLLEITLRTQEGIECIKAVKNRFPEMLVGAGSLLSLDAMKQAEEAGAGFFVTPCLDKEMLEYASQNGLTFIPGTSTPTEIHKALKKTDFVKIFPAANLGGPDYIRAVMAPFRIKEFYVVPTGGVNEKNYLEYLSLEKVIACGMTYIVDEKHIRDGDFATLGRRMKAIVSGLSNLLCK